MLEKSRMRDLDPFLLCEPTALGWRGLTAHGVVWEAKARPGEPKPVPPIGERVWAIDKAGVGVGEWAMPNSCDPGAVENYLNQQNAAIALFQSNHFAAALARLEASLKLASTSHGRFLRALVLLSLGRWTEGFAEFEQRLTFMQLPEFCARAERTGIPRWKYGESLRGKRLLLVHDAGYGDTMQMLRYVPRLRELGARVGAFVPTVLHNFVARLLPIDDITADCYCPMMSLPYMLGEGIAGSSPWRRWRRPRGSRRRRRIGIAWSVGADVAGDYPRAVPLAKLVQRLRTVHWDCELISIQLQDAEAAAALGVQTIPYRDFDECANTVAAMDEIVAVDTAAVHLAGNIGHPNIKLLLSYWHSWRWRDDTPLYEHITFCRQDAPGDWDSALRQLG